MSSPAILTRRHGFGSVVVATGHLTDPPDRAQPRFPEARVPIVEQEIERRFRAWAVGAETLVICGGARGGDLLAARTARRLGATVWLLLAHPAERFEETSVAGGDEAWVAEYWGVLARTPSWTIEIDESIRRTDLVYDATNRWMLEVAEHQSVNRPYDLLAVWDGQGADGSGGTADMVARARRRAGRVEIIDPAE